MEHKKTKYYVALLFSLGIFGMNAQQNTVSSGADASGSGGSVSYSVGQTVYTTAVGSTGSIAQGVQQPFEIQVVLGAEQFNINLKMVAYPNPTTDVLFLSIENNEISKLSYQFFDFSGKLITERKIETNSTSISMVDYPKGIYLVNVIQDNKTLKTFKIIKK